VSKKFEFAGIVIDFKEKVGCDKEGRRYETTSFRSLRSALDFIEMVASDGISSPEICYKNGVYLVSINTSKGR
jgi:hypothetical protein